MSHVKTLEHRNMICPEDLGEEENNKRIIKE